MNGSFGTLVDLVALEFGRYKVGVIYLASP
jgi:hypothetical protein